MHQEDWQICKNLIAFTVILSDFVFVMFAWLDYK